MKSEDPGNQSRPMSKPRSNRSLVLLRVVSISASLGLLLSIFRWQLVSTLTVFIEPFVEIAVFGCFFGILIWSVVHALVPFHDFTRQRLVPLAIALAACAIFVFVPFTEITLKVDFALRYSKRTAAAENIIRRFTSDNSLVDEKVLQVSLPGLSEDGEGLYWHANGKQMVFFYTFRGILERFSGYVYSEDDLPPKNGDFGGETLVEIEHLRKNWYWVACK